MSLGTPPCTQYGKNMPVKIPKDKIDIPTYRYTCLKYAKSAQTLSLSLSAIGLYIKNTTEVVKPNSATFNTVKTELNKLEIPKYSLPNEYIIADFETKEKTTCNNINTYEAIIFLFVFCVLDSIFPLPFYEPQLFSLLSDFSFFSLCH